MKEKATHLCIYGLFALLLVAIVYVFGLLYSQIENKVIPHNIPSVILECSPEIKEKIVYLDRVIYKDKIIYKEKIIYINKTVYLPKSEKIRYGVSLVGAYSNRGYSYGLGLKMQYGEYYGIAEILRDESILFSLGYEF